MTRRATPLTTALATALATGIVVVAAGTLAACSGGAGREADAAATTLSLTGDPTTAAPATTGPGEGTTPAGEPGGEGIDAADPRAVATAFGDDYLTMLSDPGDPELRTSRWASAAGVALMNTRGEQAAADGITATGDWGIRTDAVEEAEGIAVVDGCIDVSGVTGYREGVVEPWPGDLLVFSATLERAGTGWLVSGFSIPGEVCPG
ncbi:MAG: hypothetical protein ACFCVG_06915 [Kineosporiaceae bacterium]